MKLSIDLIYIILPFLLGMTTSFFCRPNANNTMNSTGKVKIPSNIFIIIWPILYLLIGISWYLSNKKLNNSNNTVNSTSNLLFWILNIFLCLWLIVYGCMNNKNLAFLILILCLMMSILCYTYVKKQIKFLLVPLIVWLIVALQISY
jgi:tryptophan-rich sensory protein